MDKLLFSLALASVALSGSASTAKDARRDTLEPSELETYIAKREAAIPGLRPRVEKTIVWADPHRRRRTPYALVYIHGFSASRQETAPLADTVAAELGANLFYTRLAGHGVDDVDAFASVTADDWKNDAREALAIGALLGEKVILVGNSTGATLALLAALERP